MFNFLALLDIRVFGRLYIAYITIVASDWPRTFFTPKVFLFSISLLFVREENIMKKLLEKLLKITILTTT